MMNGILFGGAFHTLVDDDFELEDSETCMRHCSLAHMCKCLGPEINICNGIFFESGKHFEINTNISNTI